MRNLHLFSYAGTAASIIGVIVPLIEQAILCNSLIPSKFEHWLCVVASKQHISASERELLQNNL